MSDPGPSIPTMRVAPCEARLCAVLVLDSMGLVVAANETARDLWGAGKATLSGRAFARLVSADATLPETEGELEFWKSLRTISLNHPVALSARRCDGSTLPVIVRLERSLGGAGTFIATIAPAE